MIRKASRKKSLLRIGISGISGTGKTLSALRIMHGIQKRLGGEKEIGRILVIDSEYESSDNYANKVISTSEGESYTLDYDIDPMTDIDEGAVDDMGNSIENVFDPYHYIWKIKNAEKSGYKLLIIDSLTHSWQQQLQNVAIEQATNSHVNSFNVWSKDVGNPTYNKLNNAILGFNGHVMVTFRQKKAYIITVNEKGSMKPTQAGNGIEYRKEADYEYTLFLDNVDKKQNLFLVDKDKTGMFKNEIIVPDEKFGKRLIDWAMEGVGDIYIPRTQSSPRAKELIEKITSAKELLVSEVFNSVKNVVFGEIKFNNSNDIRKLTKLRQALAQKYKNPKNRI